MNCRVLRVFAIIFVGALSIPACSSDSSGTGSNSSPNPSSTEGGAALPSDCASRCEQKATQCGAPDAAQHCAELCPSLTETSLACIETSSCDAASQCMEDSPTGGSDGGANATKDGGTTKPSQCIAVGASGCNSLNTSGECCTDSTRTKVVCNGNNDGQGHDQCCVDKGNACKDVSDCCGYAGGNDAVKSHYSCNGVCAFN